MMGEKTIYSAECCGRSMLKPICTTSSKGICEIEITEWRHNWVEEPGQELMRPEPEGMVCTVRCRRLHESIQLKS